MIGIYMYENKINHKKYIGQSVNITKRRWEHLHSPSISSKFDNYLRKVGEDQFNFTIIEECSAEELDEKEKYWIKYYDAIQNGYNLKEGGTNIRGENNPSNKLTEQEVRNIISLLKESQLSNREIAEKFNLHRNTIDMINRCKIWTYLHNYKDNIRKESLNDKEKQKLLHSINSNNKNQKMSEKQVKQIIELLVNTTLTQKQIAAQVGTNISEGMVSEINLCHTWKYLHNFNVNIRKECKGGDK